MRVRVEPPTVLAPPYGLLDVAEVVEDTSAHWRTGVEYDTINCHQSKVWGEWCTGSGEPSADTITRTIAVSFSGSRAATGGEGDLTLSVSASESDPSGYTAQAVWDSNDYSYSVAAEATYSGDYARQIKISIDVGTDDYATVIHSGQAESTVVSDSSEPVSGVATITDVLTGVSINVPIRQNVDGSIDDPDTPVVVAVPEPEIPSGCFNISTFFSARVDEDGTISVTSSAFTTDPQPRTIIVEIASIRSVITTGQLEVVIATGVGSGFHRISVRDVETDSFVSGWLYIDPDTDSGTVLIQSTCPVKEITSPPWRTVDADPFTVYAEVICKAMAFPEASEAALDALNVSQRRAVEKYYWDSLVERAQPVTTAEPVGIVRALALLEQYIASVYNGVGTIHVPPWGVSYLAHADLLDPSRWRGRYGNATNDESLRTWRGTPIVVGHGYPRGTGESVTGLDDFSMFVTGRILVRHSQASVAESFDRRTNDKSAVAERTFVVSDDCPIPGVVHVSPQGVM